MITFNRQNLFGNEFKYIKDAYDYGKVSGDGKYSRLCTEFLEKKFKVKKVFLTSSGTHALELAALIADIHQGDEIIMPSYTFVSTANAFVLRGAKPIFCDIREDNLNMDEKKVRKLISDKTKAIVPVHYAGISCEMNEIINIAKENDFLVIEDAAQGVNARYKNKYLGTIGEIGCYSFHETKNFSAGEGGAILINDETLIKKAEIMREKGTNRSQFFRGEVDKYSWVDIGSSYLLSDINAAVLYNQLEHMDEITEKRKKIFKLYFQGLKELEDKGFLRLPIINSFSEPNYHIFYILLNSEKERDDLMYYLKEHGIQSVFHYIPLHESEFFKENYKKVKLSKTEELSRRLLRFPMYYKLDETDILYIINKINSFYLRSSF